MNKRILALALVAILLTSGVILIPRVSHASSPVAYVPITLTNSQSTATVDNFSQLLIVNWSKYTSYLNANVSNVRFYSSTTFTSTNELYGWIETNNTTSATRSYVWVNLTDNIIGASGGTLIIYMVFLTNTASWSIHWGLAPELSKTYGEFDNGGHVFLSYFNGNTPVSNFTITSGYTLSQSVGVTMPNGNKGNALYLTGNGGSSSPEKNIPFVYNKGYPLEPSIVEASAQIIGDTSTDQGITGITSSTDIVTTNGIGSTMGWSDSYFSQLVDSGGTITAGLNLAGTATTTWVYGSVYFEGTSSSWTGYIAPQLYSTQGGYSGTVSTEPITSGNTLFIANLGSSGSSYNYDMYINFERARASPPNGVMPTVSFSTSITSIQGYKISFSQNSLPSTKEWGIRLNNSTNVIWSNSTGEYDNFTGLLDGSYTFQVINATGYASNPYTGLLTINGANLTQEIIFTGYKITATESGLPQGDTWYLNLSDQVGLSMSNTGQHLDSTQATIQFYLPNGTYTYTYQTSDHRYKGGIGSFSVSGANYSLSLAFNPVLYYLNFTPLDKPLSLEWAVNVSGTIITGYGLISFTLTNGTYYWNASAINGSYNDPIGYYRLTNGSGTVLLHNESSFKGMKVIINGKNYNNNITFARAYNITFQAIGIGSGTWEVNLSNGFGVILHKSLVITNNQYRIYFNSTEGNYTNGSYPGSLLLVIYGSGHSRYINFTASDTMTETINGKNPLFVYNFTTQYYLTIFSFPSKGGISSPSQGYYNESEVISLTAYPNSSYQFTGFIGSNTSSYTGMGYYSQGQYIAQITMTNAITENVTFGPYIVLTIYMENITSSTSWGVELTNNLGLVQWNNGTGYYIVFNVPEGDYSYKITGIKALPQSGNISAFNSQIVPIQYVTKTYLVDFKENGLQPGTSWQVNIFSNSFDSNFKGSTSVISLTLPNGTYSYSVLSVYGYISNDSTGSFTVSGDTLTIYVNFTQGNAFILQGIRHFVSITLNTSDYSILSGTQIPITVNWSKYQAYETANLSNVIFMNSSFYPIYAWIENNASSSFRSSTVWVKINQELPYNSSTTIYLAFESKDKFNFNKYGYIGEASQYSSLFGEYNNIGMVMNKGLAVQFYTNPDAISLGSIIPTAAIEASVYGACMTGLGEIPKSIAGLNFTAMSLPIQSSLYGTSQNVPYIELGSGSFELAKEENVILNYYLSDVYIPGTLPSPPFDYNSGAIFFGKAMGFIDLSASKTEFYGFIDDGIALGLSNNGSYLDWLGSINNQGNVINSFIRGPQTLSGNTTFQGTFRISNLFVQALYTYAFWNLWTNYNIKYYSPTFVNGVSSLVKNISIGPVASSYNSFYEYGLPVGTNWSLAISGPGISKLYTSNSNLIYTYLPNGTYLYTIGSYVNGSYHSGIDGRYIPSPVSGHVIVTGAFTVQYIIFSLNQVLKYDITPEQASGQGGNITLPLLVINIQGLPAGVSTIDNVVKYLNATLIAKNQNQTSILKYTISEAKEGMIVIFLNISAKQIQEVQNGSAVVSFVSGFQLGTIEEVAAGVAGQQIFSSISVNGPPGSNTSTKTGAPNTINQIIDELAYLETQAYGRALYLVLVLLAIMFYVLSISKHLKKGKKRKA